MLEYYLGIPMNRFLKSLGLLVVIVLLVSAGLYLYLKNVNHAYVDTTYRFVILDERGWQPIRHPQGIYYSIATVEKNDETASAFMLLPIQMPSADNNQVYSSFNQNCLDNTKMFGNTQIPEVTQITLNNLSGWECSYEGKPAYTTDMVGPSVITDYILYKKDQLGNFFLLSVSYPKGNPDELQKVNRLLNTFLVF